MHAAAVRRGGKPPKNEACANTICNPTVLFAHTSKHTSEPADTAPHGGSSRSATAECAFLMSKAAELKRYRLTSTIRPQGGTPWHAHCTPLARRNRRTRAPADFPIVSHANAACSLERGMNEMTPEQSYGPNLRRSAMPVKQAASLPAVSVSTLGAAISCPNCPPAPAAPYQASPAAFCRSTNLAERVRRARTASHALMDKR